MPVYEGTIFFHIFVWLNMTFPMKKIAIILSLTMILSSCVSIVRGGKTVKCGGDVVEKAMDFSDFTGITVEGAAHIDFIRSDEFNVTVSANQEVFDYLDYQLKGRDLVISTKDHVNISATLYKVLVQTPFIRTINIEGAAEIHLPGGYRSEEELEIEIDGAGKLDFNGIEVPTLDLNINGAGEFDLNNIQVEKLEIDLKGAGRGSVSGTADNAKLSVAGTANIDASGLNCPHIEKHVEGLAIIK